MRGIVYARPSQTWCDPNGWGQIAVPSIPRQGIEGGRTSHKHLRYRMALQLHRDPIESMSPVLRVQGYKNQGLPWMPFAGTEPNSILLQCTPYSR